MIFSLRKLVFWGGCGCGCGSVCEGCVGTQQCGKRGKRAGAGGASAARAAAAAYLQQCWLRLKLRVVRGDEDLPRRCGSGSSVGVGWVGVGARA